MVSRWQYPDGAYVPLKMKRSPPIALPIPIPTNRESLAQLVWYQAGKSFLVNNENWNASLQVSSRGLPPAELYVPPGRALTGSSGLPNASHNFPACV